MNTIFRFFCLFIFLFMAPYAGANQCADEVSSLLASKFEATKRVTGLTPVRKQCGTYTCWLNSSLTTFEGVSNGRLGRHEHYSFAYITLSNLIERARQLITSGGRSWPITLSANGGSGGVQESWYILNRYGVVHEADLSIPAADLEKIAIAFDKEVRKHEWYVIQDSILDEKLKNIMKSVLEPYGFHLPSVVLDSVTGEKFSPKNYFKNLLDQLNRKLVVFCNKEYFQKNNFSMNAREFVFNGTKKIEPSETVKLTPLSNADIALKLKEKINENTPVSMIMGWTHALDGIYDKSGILRAKSEPGESIVNHGVVVIGYREKHGVIEGFEVQNSWGTDSGVDGFYFIDTESLKKVFIAIDSYEVK